MFIKHIFISFCALFCGCERPAGESKPSTPVVEHSRTTGTGKFDNIQIESQRVAENLYMLSGAGGNIGVSVGNDGVLIVDDQFAPLAPKIRAALAALDPAEPSFVLNTHHHGDHTGGNAAFGVHATIVAHSNVRRRLLADKQPVTALPVITFETSSTIYFNGEAITIEHFANGHTDGDSIVFFPRANAVHMGDQFFNGRFPLVDLDAGGNPVSLLANVDTVLTRLRPGASVIPGHEPLGNVDDLRRYRRMLAETTDLVRRQLAEGMSLSAIQAAGVPPAWTAWGSGFVTTKRWLATLHRALTAEN